MIIEYTFFWSAFQCNDDSDYVLFLLSTHFKFKKYHIWCKKDCFIVYSKRIVLFYVNTK